jgi:hypothetical protein
MELDRCTPSEGGLTWFGMMGTPAALKWCGMVRPGRIEGPLVRLEAISGSRTAMIVASGVRVGGGLNIPVGPGGMLHK